MQTTPDRYEHCLMGQNPHVLRLGSETLPNSRGLPNRHVIYCCPHCSKQYTTSTWLDKHVKDKHSEEYTSGMSQSLADMVYSRRSIANSAAMLPQYPDPQELRHSPLVRDLQAMSYSLKCFLPLIDNLVALLQEPNGVPSRTHLPDRTDLRDLKKRNSSRDFHGHNEHQGTSTSASGIHNPRTTDLMDLNDLKNQNVGPAMTLWEGDHFEVDSSEHSQAFARCPSFEQVQGVRPPLSQQTTLSSQDPASELLQRQQMSGSSRAPKTQTPTCNATQMFRAFPRQQQGRLSPREQLSLYPQGTRPAQHTPGWVPPESMEHMSHTPLQKPLDSMSHDPSEHLSPFGALQQSLDYPVPASQHNFGYVFGQTPQQYGFLNGPSPGQSDFLTLPMQPEKAL